MAYKDKAKHNAAVLRRYHALPPAKKKAYIAKSAAHLKKTRERRMAEGKCLRCDQPPAGGTQLCAEHRQEALEYRRKTRAKKAQAEIAAIDEQQAVEEARRFGEGGMRYVTAAEMPKIKLPDDPLSRLLRRAPK